MPKIDIRHHLKDPSLFKEDAFIHGQWTKAATGERFAVNNPATNVSVVFGKFACEAIISYTPCEK